MCSFECNIYFHWEERDRERGDDNKRGEDSSKQTECETQKEKKKEVVVIQKLSRGERERGEEGGGSSALLVTGWSERAWG